MCSDGGRVAVSLREKAIIMDRLAMDRALRRMAHEMVERLHGTDELWLVGIRRRGVPLAKRLAAEIEALEGSRPVLAELDITFYRDDLSTIRERPVLSKTVMPGDPSGKRLLLVDDVLYTGRTVRAALDAVMDLGRPSLVQLAVLVDRGHRELPIRADYVGKNVPTARREVIEVRLDEIDGRDEVAIMERAGPESE